MIIPKKYYALLLVSISAVSCAMDRDEKTKNNFHPCLQPVENRKEHVKMHIASLLWREVKADIERNRPVNEHYRIVRKYGPILSVEIMDRKAKL